MPELDPASFIIVKARPVESLAARARRKGTEPGHLPDWATRSGSMEFIYAVGEAGEDEFPANITLKMTHQEGTWAFSVTVNLSVRVADGEPSLAVASLREGNYDPLGVAAWSEIRHAVRLAAYSIDARVHLPPRHPLYWRDPDEAESAV